MVSYRLVFNPFTGKFDYVVAESSIDHGNLTGLSDDDHSQYALLAGRSGGQTLIGGTDASDGLTLQSTSNATKGKILFGTSAYDEVNNRLGVATDAPGFEIDIAGDINYTGDVYLSTGKFIHKSATNSLFVGLHSGESITSGYNLVGLGDYSLQKTTSGYQSFGLGFSCLKNNTTGYQNIALGNNTLQANTSGARNVGVGINNLYSSTTGSDNIAIGYNALVFNTTGYRSTAIGSYSLFGHTTGYENTGIGFQAGNTVTTGHANIMIGYRSGAGMSASGAYNVYIGYEAGASTTGNNQNGNVFIGYQAGYNATGSYKLYIDKSSTSTPLIYGEFDNKIIDINGGLRVNQQGDDIDSWIEGDTDANLIYVDAGNDRVGISTATPATKLDVVGTSRFGDSSTNYMEIESDGDVNFVGGAGLQYGEICAVDNSTETTITVAGTAVQITIFDTDGPSNASVTPDHTNDHITVGKAGDYFISLSAAVNSVAGAASRFELSVQKNNGDSIVGGLKTHRNLAGGGGETGVVSISGMAALAASDTIEVWIENETNTQNYIVEDISLSLMQIGG